MKTLLLTILLLAGFKTSLLAQVDEIKNASSKNSSKSGGSDSDDSGDGGSVLIDFFFGNVIEWQAMKLRNDRSRYPSMVSLDVMFQGAIKPSSYYMLWPRVRGNWGLFSTDFRMNYLIEESIDGGFIHIRTNDWQVIQLNLITSRFFTFRFGTGFMQESFAARRNFSESAFIMAVHAPDQTKVLGFEYRFSKDWYSGANPRREFSVQYQHQLFETGILHGYASIGGVYQKYYNTIEVWGVQAGLILRLF
jgi:hypothetical protein